jgi:hypothetical protein
MSDMPQEAQVCDDGEAFADPVWRVHEEVRIALKASNDAYATTANQHQWVKEFEEGDMVLVYLWHERFPKWTYHKFKSRKYGPFKMLKKISSNAYLLELPPDLQISPIFNVSDLYSFDGLDGQMQVVEEQIEQLCNKT